MNKRYNREQSVLRQLMEDENTWNTEPFKDLKTALNRISKEELKDIEGFIIFCKQNSRPDAYIADNIVHDLKGLYPSDVHFAPRTEGYAKHCKTTAYLVEVTFTTRIVSDYELKEGDDNSLSQIQDTLRARIRDKADIELIENITSVVEDKEMPYKAGEDGV